MPDTQATDVSPDSRPVLLWAEETDESHVKPSLQEAGEFLNASPEAVAHAIVSGEPLHGWFVDWEAQAENA